MLQNNSTLVPPITFEDGIRKVSLPPLVQAELLDLIDMQTDLYQKKEEVQELEERIQSQLQKIKRLIRDAEDEHHRAVLSTDEMRRIIRPRKHNGDQP